jgi:single-strand DNA-binding protein
MRGVNKVMLIGNIGKDPDIQYLEGNIAVAKFPLATTETYKDKTGTLVSQTEWHTIVLWRGLADLAQKYLHKGSLVYIEGRIRTRNWEDKDKNRRYSIEILGDNLVMLDKRKEQTDGQTQDTPIQETGTFPGNFDNSGIAEASKDDLPF